MEVVNCNHEDDFLSKYSRKVFRQVRMDTSFQISHYRNPIHQILLPMPYQDSCLNNILQYFKALRFYVSFPGLWDEMSKSSESWVSLHPAQRKLISIFVLPLIGASFFLLRIETILMKMEHTFLVV